MAGLAAMMDMAEGVKLDMVSLVEFVQNPYLVVSCGMIGELFDKLSF